MKIAKRYSANIIKALITVLVLSILTHFPGAFSVDLWGAKVEYVGPQPDGPDGYPIEGQPQTGGHH